MAWKVWCVDTETGARKGLLSCGEATWAHALNASGAGEASFVVGDRDSFGQPGKYLTEPVSTILVIEWDGTPIYGGIIWVREYSRDSRTVKLTYADPWSILGQRLVVAYHSAGVEKEPPLIYGPLSLETQVKRAVQAATAGEMFALPIVLPADMAGVHIREYAGYHLPTWTAVVKKLTSEQYGPDIVFAPRWRPSDPKYFEWVMNIGVPEPGLLVWNLTARKDGASGLVVTEDANRVANHIIGTGQGTEADMLTRSAIHGASPYPALVKTVSYSQVNDGDELQSLVDAELDLYKQPTEQWSFSILAGSEYKVTELRPGLGVRAYLKDDPWLADGFRNLRLIGFSGDLGPSVQLQFQPNEAVGFSQSSRTRVAAIGDSLTAGYFGGVGNLPTDAYPYRLQQIVPAGVEVFNLGSSGYTVDEEAVRIGALPVPLTVSGGSIPATGPVTVTTTAVIGWRPAGTTRTIVGSLSGVPGVLTRTSSDTSFTFTRTTGGAAVPVSGSPVFVPDYSGHDADTVVILLGRNNVTFSVKGADASVAEHVANGIARIVNWLSPDAKQALVISATTSTSERSGTAAYATVADINNRLQSAFPYGFVDLRTYLAHQAIADLGITPTTADLTAISGDTLPPSIMDGGTDQIHWSKATAELVAAKINESLVARGWV